MVLGVYRPISLIHMFAKLAAKAVALRVAPRLESLVDRNHRASISKRCIHDNFMLVQQTARLLQRLKEPEVMLKLDLARVFTSASWGLLFKIPHKMGLGSRLRELMVAIFLSTTSTRVTLNGEPAPPPSATRGA
jgi:hypothetical protein